MGAVDPDSLSGLLVVVLLDDLVDTFPEVPAPAEFGVEGRADFNFLG